MIRSAVLGAAVWARPARPRAVRNLDPGPPAPPPGAGRAPGRRGRVRLRAAAQHAPRRVVPRRRRRGRGPGRPDLRRHPRGGRPVPVDLYIMEDQSGSMGIRPRPPASTASGTPSAGRSPRSCGLPAAPRACRSGSASFPAPAGAGAARLQQLRLAGVPGQLRLRQHHLPGASACAPSSALVLLRRGLRRAGRADRASCRPPRGRSSTRSSRFAPRRHPQPRGPRGRHPLRPQLDGQQGPPGGHRAGHRRRAHQLRGEEHHRGDLGPGPPGRRRGHAHLRRSASGRGARQPGRHRRGGRHRAGLPGRRVRRRGAVPGRAAGDPGRRRPPVLQLRHPRAAGRAGARSAEGQRRAHQRHARRAPRHRPGAPTGPAATAGAAGSTTTRPRPARSTSATPPARRSTAPAATRSP